MPLFFLRDHSISCGGYHPPYWKLFIMLGLLALCYFNAHPHSCQETKSTAFALINIIYAVDL